MVFLLYTPTPDDYVCQSNRSCQLSNVAMPCVCLQLKDHMLAIRCLKVSLYSQIVKIVKFREQQYMECVSITTRADHIIQSPQCSRLYKYAYLDGFSRIVCNVQQDICAVHWMCMIMQYSCRDLVSSNSLLLCRSLDVKVIQLPSQPTQNAFSKHRCLTRYYVKQHSQYTFFQGRRGISIWLDILLQEKLSGRIGFPQKMCPPDTSSCGQIFL